MINYYVEPNTEPMSGDYFTHNDRQPCISNYSALKWDSTGELSSLDMNRILGLLQQPEECEVSVAMDEIKESKWKDVTFIESIHVNARYRNGSAMQE